LAADTAEPGISGYNLCEFDCAAQNVSNLCRCKSIGRLVSTVEPKAG